MYRVPSRSGCLISSRLTVTATSPAFSTVPHLVRPSSPICIQLHVKEKKKSEFWDHWVRVPVLSLTGCVSLIGRLALQAALSSQGRRGFSWVGVEGTSDHTRYRHVFPFLVRSPLSSPVDRPKMTPRSAQGEMTQLQFVLFHLH